MTAAYFDGRSAVRHSVQLRLAGEGLMLTREDGRIEHWPFHSYRVQRSPGDRFLRFERAPYRGECLLVEDPADIARILAELRHSGSSPARRKRLAAILVVATVAICAALYAAFPLVVSAIARFAPVAWEQRLGRAVSLSLAPMSERITDPAAARAIAKVATRLHEAAPGPYHYQVSLTREATVNAWAAPGGYVNVYCGLVQRLDSGDEFAAILAHEFQHVTQRHSTRNLVRTLLIRTALTLTGTGGEGLFDTAAMLGALQLMRGDESAADALGLELLERARIDPRAMARAFERIDHDSTEPRGDLPGALDYLSTHPSTQSRIEAARRAARSGQYEPALSPAEWKQLQQACYSLPESGSGK
ncbi:MAG: M48 family metallopeptidase [Acidobacteria bacterium]|nr:M48 family metallopeptidase [Acidobacteriota bacterium]